MVPRLARLDQALLHSRPCTVSHGTAAIMNQRLASAILSHVQNPNVQVPPSRIVPLVVFANGILSFLEANQEDGEVVNIARVRDLAALALCCPGEVEAPRKAMKPGAASLARHCFGSVYMTAVEMKPTQNDSSQRMLRQYGTPTAVGSKAICGHDSWVTMVKGPNCRLKGQTIQAADRRNSYSAERHRNALKRRLQSLLDMMPEYEEVVFSTTTFPPVRRAAHGKRTSTHNSCRTCARKMD